MRGFDAGILRFSILASSEGRFWKGIDATVYDISPGINEQSGAPSHTIVLHLSAPVEGTCTCEGLTLRRIIKPGDIDFVPLGHAVTWHYKGPVRAAVIRLSASMMRTTATEIGHGNVATLSFPSKLSLRDPVLRYLAQAVVAELETGDNGPVFAGNVGTAIATHLLNRYGQVGSAVRSRGLSNQQLSQIVEYIDANLATKLSLSEIARVAGVSVSHLKTLFKRAIGVSVHQYIIQQRVDRAMRLLSQSDVCQSEIAEQVGFSSQSHMARCMRRIIGETPSKFARSRLS